MQNLPLVSVICISYNHAPYIEEALNSVIQQSYPNIELLITDDCSTDNSKEVIENWLQSHPTIPFFPNTTNLGNTITFNNVLKHAKGEYIIDLAADDILLKNCITIQINTFLNSKYKKLGIVYANIELVDEKGNYLYDYYTENDNPPSGDIYYSVVGQLTKICSVASIVKRDVFETVGTYDESLAYEDLDLWIRASRVFDFEYISTILAQKRELPNSLSAQFYKKNNAKTRKLNKSSLKILRKAFLLNKNKKEYQSLLKQIHYEMHKNLVSRNYSIFLKLVLLEIKIRMKLLLN
jgi:glycosyltransferase involved in cell wall biosynthesis